MDLNQTRALLQSIAPLDTWLSRTPPDMAAEMVPGWQTILDPVPLDFAMQVVKQHYSAPDARTIQPGDIASAWRNVESRRRREEEQAEDRREREETYRQTGDRQPIPLRPRAKRLVEDGAQPERLGMNGKPEWFDRMVAAYHAAHVDGRALDTVPLPFIPQSMSGEERRERRCKTVGCHCDHVMCRGGWLDEEQMIYSKFGDHPAVVPCDTCRDAATMAAENAPKKRRA